MKAELKTLSKEHADIVAAHLLAAASLIDDDPDLAFRHAEAAKRRAARLPVVREATAETAYAAGRYEDALSEFRALRRMNGSPDYLPVLADCERALGRQQAALRLIAEGEATIKDPGLLVELRLVQAGVRTDLGQRDEALRLLRTEIESPRQVAPKDAQARLRYAYADLLLAGGDETGARDWFAAAVRLDPEGQTDALDRLDELDGMVLILDEDDLDDETTPDEGATEGDEGATEGDEADETDPTAADEPASEDPPVDETPVDDGPDEQPPAGGPERDATPEPEPEKPKRSRKKAVAEPAAPEVTAAPESQPAAQPEKPTRTRKKAAPE